MHKLLIDQPGKKMVLLGNEAIARGAIEAGVAVTAAYPGTPSSEIAYNFFQMSHESDLYFEYSANEKVSLEVVAATANAGVRSMCTMKHVGVNVAADALMTLAYVGVKAGLVVLVADDPSMFSSQNEQDTRYYGKLSGLPIIEPSSIEEAKEMVPYAFDLSEKLQEPVILRTTTRINHSTATVTFGNIRKRITKGDFAKDPFNYVTVPAISRKLHVKLLANLDKAAAISETTPYNYITGSGSWGIICNGVSFNYVVDAVKDLKIQDKVKILRIGFSNPMPANMIKSFLSGCEKAFVVEEGEPYMEEAVKAFAQEAALTLPIKGKGKNLLTKLYEFNPSIVRQAVANFFEIPYTTTPLIDVSDIPEIPQRPPNLCAGCSHRAAFYEIKKAAEGMETIYTTDIGCYTLGFMPPLSMGDYLICMGASTSSPGGFGMVTDKKVVSFIGDSTFFHSGMTGLANAVFNNHNFTLVILDNGTTAMTGHQPHPGVDMSLLKLDGYNRVSIEAVVRAMGVPKITIVQPFKVKKSIEAIRETLKFKGVSVILVQEMCILYAKEVSKVKAKPFYVSNKCKDHRNCVNELACPAFILEDKRVKIDPARCTGCAVCAQVCPENAILPLKE